MMVTTMRAGLQRAYLDGLEFIRNKISETEAEVQKCKHSFYGCAEDAEDKFVDYLKRCNENFLVANNELRRKNIKLEVVDSEMRVVAVLNQLREAAEVDKGEITFITEFWENIKDTIESFRTLVEKFQSNVLDRLNKSCISYNNEDIHLDVSNRYTEEISTHLSALERELTNMRLLIKTFEGGIHQDLFSPNSSFTEKVLVSCDLKAFPILRLIPDLTEKLENACAIAQKWLDRDEQYMYEVNNYIRETRNITRQREEDLKNRKEKQRKIEKAVRSAHIMLHSNKEKLQKIESDLNQLEEHLNGYQHEKKCKAEEKQQKSTMADFLKLTLSQTKRNYSLQIKRKRIVKQVKELEELLLQLERELSNVQDEMIVKSQEKYLLTEKVETTEKTYGALKTDFDKYSDNLEQLEHEVNILSGQLLQLEIIQTYKTSPENVEQIFDRPSTVKLAPSLKEKIKRKRKGLAPVE
ncbi:hypothetical protein FSP39_018580 [Pinctada imbricata]|uniref:Uncharacterized protein n=1 Tax=Pinctada imbricata TaxID=66713 RepID=A0AA88Y9G7_PINIB|nr:hypothetical protein FSP39_018580 [Pinctada imbricata]